MASRTGLNVIKLLGLKASPNTNRVQIALNLKGIPYELSEEDLFNKSELLLASNPVYKRIPVLIHESNPISESLTIVEYIDEVWSTHHQSFILPVDPFDRSLARFWASYLDNVWLPLIKKFREDPPTEEEAKRGYLDKINEGFLLLEEAFVKCSKRKAFFGGDNIGYLDIALGPFWSWLPAVETLTETRLVDDTKTPNLCRWGPRFFSHEAVKDVLLGPDQLVDVVKMFQAKGWNKSTRPS
ncbi:OLC1v1022002C1 [Oldenlandia corymbosa var. corymbosa]|uniref:glutathione transferase n=1 Tax=Oldenlandia corymbosa var. corymbosa TaxID=529605 RepID=A0AAV1BWW3_OLDCO|nr:OLC1v1022002C1 [Oldenlandia corymbosa var. corymbosa]